MNTINNIISKVCVPPNISIESAIIALKKSGYRCLVIVAKNNELLGTLTDGDLRAVILKRMSIKYSIKNCSFLTKPYKLKLWL